MEKEDRDPFDEYQVVINHEEQYSIWPTVKEMPLGWTAVGKKGPKKECLEYIKEVWKDIRPLSVRKLIEKEQQS